MTALRLGGVGKRCPAGDIGAHPPSLQPVDLATTKGQPVRCTLLNLPHYLTWRIGELVDQL